jgi:hypothetical protein
MEKYSIKIIWVFLFAAIVVSCNEDESALVKGRPDSIINNDESGAPAREITQTWNNVEQVLYREFYDSNVAIYYDESVDRSIVWPRSFTSQVWDYVQNNYGLGSELLYAIFHTEAVTPFAGNIYDESTTNKYLFDISIQDGEAKDSDKDLILEQISKIVEISAFGVNKSPASAIWKEKWTEIFMYDVYTVINMEEDAQRIKSAALASQVDYPSAETSWFKDWFLPIYEASDKGFILSNFFRSLSLNFPVLGSDYGGDLNMGEFIHFYSAAVGDDLQELAESAFGWNTDWDTQLRQARADFPSVNYPFEPTSEIVDLTGNASISVSVDNTGGPTAGEGSLKLIDNNTSTKFLTFSYSTSFWMQQTFVQPEVINRYSLTSANDDSSRDPKTWELVGSDDEENWTVLDSRSDIVFSERGQTVEFIFENNQSFKHYRINISENRGSGLLQIAEWRLKVLRLIQP